jgi:acyl carrier protein
MDILDRVTALARPHLPLSAQNSLSNPDAELETLGLDSLALAGFLMDLEAEFGVSFPAVRITRETFRSMRTTEAALRSLLAMDPPAGDSSGM